MNEISATVMGEIIGVQGHKDSTKDVAYAYVKNGMKIFNLAGRRATLHEGLINKMASLDCRITIYERDRGPALLQVWAYSVNVK